MGKKKKKKKNGGDTQAATADKYTLYQDAVQDADHECRIFRRFYKEVNGKEPHILREDFCGTAAICCEWVKRSPKHESWGVDLDPEPLGWGKDHNLAPLKEAEKARVHLLEDDVRTAKTPKADVLAAQNYSFFLFKKRDELLSYFKTARGHVGPEGIMVMDMMGGPGAMQDDDENVRKIGKGVRYIWHEARFDPITNDALFHIHFKFKDGSRLYKAFTYDWRLWSIPEVRELLAEAGFKESFVYWEGTDAETGEGNGVFKRREKADADELWLAYIVATV
jgi:hypothetical protein